jgi:hypothetical protein
MPIITTHELNAIQQKLKSAEENYALARLLGTPEGFFQHYFKILPSSRTQIEAFNDVNDQYFEIFGDWRYSDYNSFRLCCKNYKSKK